MNLRNVAVVVGAVVGLTAAMAAQAIPDGPTAPSKVQAKSVTITGCVAQGVDADHYVLSNATRREQPPSSAAVAGKSPTGGSDIKAKSDRTGPYDLQGGEFKAHLGHLVEVTGTGGNTDKSPDPPTIENATERKPLPTFNVLSVKMLSATCT